MYHTTIFGQGRVTSAHNPPPRTVSIRQRVQTQSASTRHACMEPLAGPRLGSPMDLPICVQTCSTGIGKAARPCIVCAWLLTKCESDTLTTAPPPMCEGKAATLAPSCHPHRNSSELCPSRSNLMFLWATLLEICGASLKNTPKERETHP